MVLNSIIKKDSKIDMVKLEQLSTLLQCVPKVLLHNFFSPQFCVFFLTYYIEQYTKTKTLSAACNLCVCVN